MEEATSTANQPTLSRTQNLKDKGVVPWWIKQREDGNWNSFQSGNDEKERAKTLGSKSVSGPYLSKVEADKHVQEKMNKIKEKEKSQASKKPQASKKANESAMKPFRSFLLSEEPTRQHFQMVADLLKANPDKKKRLELAKHHADVFAKQNSRFDRKRFMQAADVTEAVDYKEAPPAKGAANQFAGGASNTAKFIHHLNRYNDYNKSANKSDASREAAQWHKKEAARFEKLAKADDIAAG